MEDSCSRSLGYAIFTCLILHLYTVNGAFSPPLYPYGNEAGDTAILDTTLLYQVNLSFPLKFYGRTFKSIYISKNGFVSFSPKAAYMRNLFRENPVDHNEPLIAPYYFHGAVKTPGDTKIPGRIYYRTFTDVAEPEFMETLRQYMINTVVGVHSFNPTVAFQVTWDDVTDSTSADEDCLQSDNAGLCKTNTFQVLVVGENTGQTFAVFNYGQLSVHPHPVDQAGINGGYNMGWTDIYCESDGCPSTDLQRLPNLQGSDVVGRFIYQVSEKIIVRGGCLPKGSTSGRLEFSPRFANLYGGEIVDVSGYCVSDEDQVGCKFGFSEEVPAVRFPGATKHRCQVPRMTERGVVDLVVTSTQSGQITAPFHIVLFGRSEKNLLPYNPENPDRIVWNETNPVSLSLKWRSTKFSSNLDESVSINLIGYREDSSGFYWEHLDTLGEDVMNADGQYTFLTSDHQCTGEQCWLYEVGVVEVRYPQKYWTPSTKYGSLSFGVVPLGWFVRDYMLEKYGEDWNNQKCVAWYEEDKKDMSWQDELLPCPCNLDQAVTDFGRWQPDVGCNLYTGSHCHYHKGAVHCVRSVNPTQSGAGNQCCYGDDGGLMYAADSYQGSTPDRGHDWGAPPFNSPDHVPSLSHWIHDVVSFYHCCLWVGNSLCDYYMEQRATRDCKDYTPPVTAFLYGDPHMETFDKVTYDFFGLGDFWLLKSDQLSVQGRFEEAELSYESPVNLTVLTGVAMSTPGGSVIEIRFNTPPIPYWPVLNVLVDNQPTVFGDGAPEWQDYKGFSVVQNDFIENIDKHSNFTVMFQSGVGINVAAVERLLYVTVVIPPEMKGGVAGLFGNGDEVMDNDFTLPDGRIISSTSAPDEIYQNFVLFWKVLPEDKNLFQFAHQDDPSFVPSINLNPSTDQSAANPYAIRSTCQEVKHCTYDYIVTGSKAVGMATKDTWEWMKNVARYQVKVPSCGLLDVPGSIKSNRNYTLGSRVRITGCKDGSLSGHTEYDCVRQDGDQIGWEPPVSASCYGSPDQSNMGVIIGVTVAMIVVVAVIIVIVVILLKRQKSTEAKTPEDIENERYGQPSVLVPMVKPRTTAPQPAERSEKGRSQELSSL